MRVLVVEDVEAAAEPVIERLLGAGHEVVRCNDPGAPGFPCKGIGATPACPLDDGPVTVAVVVRGATREAPTSRETGARCALRRRIPLVEVGQHSSSPYLAFAAAVSPGPQGVVLAAEQAGAAALPAHGAEAERVLRDVLDRHGLPEVAATAEVHRSDGALRVLLTPDATIPKHVAEVAAVRALGALRALDPDAVTIGVSVTTATSP